MSNAPSSHTILPCPICGKTPDGIKASRSLGRVADCYRVECHCGNGGLSMWSPTEASAVRQWNRYNVQAIEGEFPQ